MQGGRGQNMWRCRANRAENAGARFIVLFQMASHYELVRRHGGQVTSHGACFASFSVTNEWMGKGL